MRSHLQNTPDDLAGWQLLVLLLNAMMPAFGWRMMFIIIGVSGIILSVLWFMFYRKREDAGLSAEDIAHLEEETPPSGKEKVTLKDWAGLFKQK